MKELKKGTKGLPRLLTSKGPICLQGDPLAVEKAARLLLSWTGIVGNGARRAFLGCCPALPSAVPRLLPEQGFEETKVFIC